MRDGRRRQVAALCLLAAAVLAGCTGDPIPYRREVVCDECVTSVENASENVTVEDSVTHVRIEPDGDATVVARIEVSGAGVAALRDNETLVDRMVGELESRPPVRTRPAFERRNLDGRVENETVIVRYQVRDFADARLGGTVLSDQFFRLDGDGRPNEQDYEEPILVGTDRLVVHPPNGTAALVTPPSASVEDGRVVWTDRTVPTRTYLAFGEDTTAGLVAGHAAIALDVMGWAGPTVGPAVVAYTLVLGALGAVFAVRYPGKTDGGWSPWTDTTLRWLVGGMALLAAVLVSFIFAGPVGLLPLALIVAAVVGWRRRTAGDESTTEGAEPTGEADGRPDDARPGRSTPSADRHATDAADDTRGEAGRDVRGWLAGIVGTVAVAALLGMLAAADFGATGIAGTVLLVAAPAPLAAFAALGVLVTVPQRTTARATAAATVAVAPWLAGLSWAVQSGGHDLDAFASVALWGAFCAVVGPVVFYVVLNAVTD